MKEYVIDLVPYYQLDSYINRYVEKGYCLERYYRFDKEIYLVVMRWINNNE